MPVLYHEKLGRKVICDYCDHDYTESTLPGGLIFESKAVCPRCEPRIRASIRHYNEKRHIKAENSLMVPFAQFVREFRGPDASIIVRTFDGPQGDRQ